MAGVESGHFPKSGSDFIPGCMGQLNYHRDHIVGIIYFQITLNCTQRCNLINNPNGARRNFFPASGSITKETGSFLGENCRIILESENQDTS